MLGAGGVLGAAWTIGALHALQAVDGFDPRTAEVVVGTSAGSVLAALVGSGVGVESLVNHQRGVVVEGDPRLDYDYDKGSGGPLPPWPRLRLGSRQLLLHTARHPRRLPPLAVMSAMLPEGRGTLDVLGGMVDHLMSDGDWVAHPATWVVAMDYDSGRRVAFGRDGAPPATMAAAVTASCAIPGWYAPVTIGGRRYVDGGASSSTSVDLVAGLGLDEVYVLAPMASFAIDRPPTIAARLERAFRRLVTRRMLREADKVSDTGTDVTMLCPGPADLEVIGANLMDPRRRLRVLERSVDTSAKALRDLAAERPDPVAAS